MKDNKILDYFDKYLYRNKENECMTEIIDMECRVNTEMSIPTYSEAFFPLNIKIKKSCDLNKLICFDVCYGHNLVSTIPIKLLIQLSGLYSDNEYYYINLKPKLFFIDGQDRFYIGPYIPFNIILKGDASINYTMELLYFFQRKNTEHYNMSYLVNSYHENKIFSNRTEVNDSINNCPGFFVETYKILDNVTIMDNNFQIQKYNKFILDSFKIKMNKWNYGQQRDIKKIISRHTCTDVANLILSYIPSIYLYYIPFDILNGMYDTFHEETVMYNGRRLNIAICFKEQIDAYITFVSMNKITIDQTNILSGLSYNSINNDIIAESLT